MSESKKSVKAVLIAAAVILLGVSPGYAMTAEEGQALFDGVFWQVMTVWCLGLSLGLVIKLINRS